MPEVQPVVKWTDIVAAIVVIYSAVLSTYNLWRSIADDKPKIKVEYKYGFLVGMPMDDGEQKFIITFYNTGKVNVKIEECGIVLPGGYKLAFTSDQFTSLPKIVEPGDHIQQIRNISKVKTELANAGYLGGKTLRGYCRDGLSKYHYGKRFSFSMNIDSDNTE